MRIVRLAEAPTAPWKNGGGETTEIAVFPAGAGFDVFGWRISLARVGADGPFSVFAGIDRTLTLIEGTGMDLAVDGTVHRLTAGAPPLPFPGDVPAAARLLDGPIRDLNVMSRRAVFTHHVTLAADAVVARDAADVATAVTALADVRIGAEILAAGDTAFLDPAETVALTGRAAVIRIGHRAPIPGPG